MGQVVSPATKTKPPDFSGGFLGCFSVYRPPRILEIFFGIEWPLSMLVVPQAFGGNAHKGSEFGPYAPRRPDLAALDLREPGPAYPRPLRVFLLRHRTAVPMRQYPPP